MQYQIKQLGIGGILDQAVNLTKNHFGLLFGIVALTFVPIQLIVGYLQLQGTQQMIANMRAGGAVGAGLPSSFIAMYAVLFVFGIFVMPVAYAAMIYAIGASYLSRPTSVGASLAHGLRRWGALVWTFIILYLAVIGLVMAVAIVAGISAVVLGPFSIVVAILLGIPAIILFLTFSLAAHVAVLERQSGSSAITRSRALMRGNVGSLFVLFLVIGVINFLVGFGAQFIPQPYVAIVVSVIVQAFLTVFGAAALVVFYFSARCKHENFDLQLLSEAIEQA
jgi:hypothetical protein